MRRLPKLMESWTEGDVTIEIYEDLGALPNNPHCDVTSYRLKIITHDSRKFPVLTGAIKEAKKILNRKNNRELRTIKTNFDLNGKNEKDKNEDI